MIIAAAAFLRLHLLGAKDLWIDEAASVAFAQLPWVGFWTVLRNCEGNMAFYYVLLRGWIHLGDSEFALRSLSVLFGLATIPAVYVLGDRFLGRKAGLASAALLAVHSFHIRYSQEARSYSLLVLLLVLSTHFYLLAVQSPRQNGYWVAYTLASVLAVYAHVFAVLVLAAQWLSLGLARFRQVGFAAILRVAAPLAVLVSPMAAFVVLKHGGQLWWIPRPTIGSLLYSLRYLTGSFSLPNPTGAQSNALLLLYTTFWALAVWGLLRKPSSASQDETLAVRLIVLWLVLPISSTFLFSFIKPLFFVRYLVICVPAIALLAGHGMATLDRFSPRLNSVFPLALIAMIGLSLGAVDRYYKSFPSWGNDWRLVTQHLLARGQPGDAAFFHQPSGNRPFAYYAHRESVQHGATPSFLVVFPPVGNLQDPCLRHSRAQFELAASRYKRVWLVLHHAGEVSSIRSALAQRFRLLEEKQFPGYGSGAITVELYGRLGGEEEKNGR